MSEQFWFLVIGQASLLVAATVGYIQARSAAVRAATAAENARTALLLAQQNRQLLNTVEKNTTNTALGVVDLAGMLDRQEAKMDSIHKEVNGGKQRCNYPDTPPHGQ